MSVDTFKPRELADISNLALLVGKFNREQVGERSLFAEVTLYRNGDPVAALAETASFGADGADGELSLEVKESK